MRYTGAKVAKIVKMAKKNAAIFFAVLAIVVTFAC